MYLPKQNWLQKLKIWAKKRQSLLLLGLALLVIIGTGSYLLAMLNTEPDITIPKNRVIRVAAPKFYSPLTGSEVADEATTQRRVTAIMIENSPDARPQSGLKDAGVVFETIAEGGITRFIALYQEARPALIGPVRSVRPYYVEWADAFDASVAHIGGSARALEMIRSGSYGVDLDQFFNAEAYWRATDRYAPHNVYTSFDRLDALNQQKGATSSSFTAFERKEDKKLKTPVASVINVEISGPLYNSSYSYEPTSNSYLRSQAGEPHTDREAGQLQPKVIVVIKVAITKAFEDGYREQIATSGSGEAFIFQDGNAVEGTWSKAASNEPIVVTAADGTSLKLNRGQTWITAIPTQESVSWQ